MTKYHAVPVIVDGVRFASKREGARYGELSLMQAAGEIQDLVCHPSWPLMVNGHKVARYVADFSYYDCKADRPVVEDVKGYLTPVYKIKRNLMKAIYGIEILET